MGLEATLTWFAEVYGNLCSFVLVLLNDLGDMAQATELATLHVIIKPGGWNWEICPGGWIRLVWTTDPGGEIPPKSQIRLLEKVVYTSRFSTRKPKPCNNHTYNFHVSGLLNLSFADPEGAKKKFEDLAAWRIFRGAWQCFAYNFVFFVYEMNQHREV